MRQFKQNKTDRFKHHSEAAALAERQGKYALAADEWGKAANEVDTVAQLHRCQHRANFCDRMHENPFVGE